MTSTTDAQPALIEYLCRLCQTRELDGVDPLSLFAGRLKAPPRARINTRTIPMTFEGSAAGLQRAADAGFRAKMSIGEALQDKPRAIYGLRPHARRAEDRKQGVTPEDYDLENVLINSVVLAEPHNTLSQSVGIVTSTLPAVYADLKKQQTEDLASELGVTVVNPNVVAHIPSTERPDPKSIPILKVWGQESYLHCLHHCACTGSGEWVPCERGVRIVWWYHSPAYLEWHHRAVSKRSCRTGV